MIHENVKLQTLYKNTYSGQETYFLARVNNVLFGVRRDQSTNWKWNFGTWRSYSNPNVTENEIELNEEWFKKMQKITIAGIFNTDAKFL